MPAFLASLLESRPFQLFARIVLTFCFWGAGLAKLIDFPGGVAEMAAYGLQPAAALNVLAVVTLLGGSLLVIADRWAWLGAGALATFTALTIPLVHHFWTMEGEAALAHFHTATEHVTVIGAMMVLAILSQKTEAARASAAGHAPLPAGARAG